MATASVAHSPKLQPCGDQREQEGRFYHRKVLSDAEHDKALASHDVYDIGMGGELRKLAMDIFRVAGNLRDIVRQRGALLQPV